MIYSPTAPRLRFVARVVGVLTAGLLIACQPSPTASPPARSSSATGGAATSPQMQQWEQVVAAARQEGELTLYGAISGGIREALIEPFEKAYPGIKVNGTFAPANDLVPRILAERDARKYIPDVIVGPASQAVLLLKPVGAVAPLEPAFLHPEVTDLSLWYQNRRWWVDSSEPYTTMAFQAYVGTTITYNSQMVDPREFTSFADLLNPKWRGKIVSNDIRRPGQGSVQVRYVYGHPDLGPAFLNRLFSEMDVTLSTDHRQMVDWIAQGRYPIGLWISSTQMKAAMELGLPVGEIPGDQLREGAPISIGGGTINLAGDAPHPNAARVFINWLLSKDGQDSWQEHVQQPSLRLDVSRAGLDPTGIPKPGVQYADGGTEEYLARVPSEDITAIVEQGLARATR
ncbi:MAG: ABC-type Fe3+ transport system periplasmic component [Chloroflexi bacterium]|nr:ABC-type Fe3+ transport system periplasmic component [Chloroflexota bacterium]